MRYRQLLRFGPAIMLSVGILAGCATHDRLVYDRPGLRASDSLRDENECLRGAVGHDAAGRILTLMQIDRDAYARCMEGRGYAARPAS